jgi:hypothetical protein
MWTLILIATAISVAAGMFAIGYAWYDLRQERARIH